MIFILFHTEYSFLLVQVSGDVAKYNSADDDNFSQVRNLFRFCFLDGNLAEFLIRSFIPEGTHMALRSSL